MQTLLVESATASLGANGGVLLAFGAEAKSTGMAGLLRLVSESSNRSKKWWPRFEGRITEGLAASFSDGQHRLSTMRNASLGETYWAADRIFGRRTTQASEDSGFSREGAAAPRRRSAAGGRPKQERRQS